MNGSDRQLTRKCVFEALDTFGANALMRRMNTDVVRVLTLHGVSSPTSSDLWVPLRLQLEVSRFDMLLRELTKKYQFITMDTAVEVLNGHRKPISNSIALTFDDGYSNNFMEALPVLEKYDVPATFYITTKSVTSRQPFWFDRLDFAVQSAAAKGMQVDFAGKEFAFDSPCRKAVSRSFGALRAHAKCAFSDERDFTRSLNSLALKLEQETGQALSKIVEQDHWSRVSTVDELAEIAKHPLVTLGSHTVSHLRLSFADGEQMAHELQESKRKIEEWTGKPVRHFAYPNGAFDKRSMRAVCDAGYISAVNSDAGFNKPGHDLMQINRHSVPNNFWAGEIQARASGLELAIVSRLKRLTSGEN